MSSMATFSFYNEIQISECPSNINEFKEKIKELFCFNEEQMNNFLVSYIFDNKHYYILDENQYETIIPLIEFIVLKIEISDECKYFVIDQMPEEEYELHRFEDNDKKEKKLETEDDDEDSIEYEPMDYEEEMEYEKEETNRNNSNIIQCSICGEEIRGIRYLCGICQNFNFCEECENKEGEQHNHPLLKIRNPALAPVVFKCIIGNEKRNNNF